MEVLLEESDLTVEILHRGAEEVRIKNRRCRIADVMVTLGRQLKPLASGLTARSALEKFAAMQMVGVHIPTTDGRELLLTRYTQPEPELALLLERLRLTLPPQPPPKTSAAQATTANAV